jgi:hypothetical protein
MNPQETTESDVDVPSPTRVRVRRRSTRGRRQRRQQLALKWGGGALLAVALILLGDGIYASWKLATTLHELPGAIEEARAALGDARLDAAEARFGRLRTLADDFSRAVGRPSFRLLGITPGIGDDVDSLAALARATDLSTSAGVSAIDAGRALKVTPQQPLGELFRDGRVDLDIVRDADPFVAEAAGYLIEADEALDVESPQLPILATGFDTAQRVLSSAAETARKAGAAFEVMPELLGAQTQREYLLAFQALGEARATGGVLGTYGTLEANTGRLRLRDIHEVTKGFPTSLGGSKAQAPRSFRKSYGPQSALVQSQQTNVSPNFPIVADVWLQMHESKTGRQHDGVAAMDPVALQMMMKGTDEVRAPDGEMLDASEVVEALSVKSYAYEVEARQQAYLEGIVRSFWDNVYEGRFEAEEFVEGLALALESQHLKIYSTSEDEQEALDTLSASGYSWADVPNVQMIWHNNYGGNKLDYYARRDIETKITFESPEVMAVDTTAIMRNLTPDESPLLQVGPSARRGINVMTLNVMAPEEATFGGRSTNGRQGRAIVYPEGTHPVTWRLLRVGPGEELAHRVEYRAPTHEEDGEVEMWFVPQPMFVADDLALELQAPPGYLLEDVGSSGAPTRRLSMTKTLNDTVKLRIRLVAE